VDVDQRLALRIEARGLGRNVADVHAWCLFPTTPRFAGDGRSFLNNVQVCAPAAGLWLTSASMIGLPTMPDARSKQTTRTRPDSRGDARRRRIFKSLHDCIIRQGYVKTTLADIAASAGMSPSHLLYYFKGKEDILEQYFEMVSARFLERLGEFSHEAPDRQIHLLADFWFKGETSTKMEIGFMLECFGAAVHDNVLKVTKAEFDVRCKGYLIRIFEAAPSVIIEDSKDAAEVAYSLMIGLRSAVYFDDDISLDDAHRLFIGTLLSMCAIPPG